MRSRRFFEKSSRRLVFGLLLAFSAVGQLLAAVATSSDASTAVFIKEHCLRCHGPEKTKGDFRLDQLDTDLSKPSAFERWREVMARSGS